MSSESSVDRPPAEAGRPSAVEPTVKLERRVSPFFGFIFYGFLFAVAWVWLQAGAIDVRALWTPRNLALELAVGIGAGVLLAGATPWFVRAVPVCRELEREFGWILGEQRAWECLYLAILSGVAEEFFFRGALHQAVGPWLGLVVFAALHWPVNGQFAAWPFTALVAGVVLTAERMWTGTLVAPVATHIIVNAVNLLRISRKYRVWKE